MQETCGTSSNGTTYAILDCQKEKKKEKGTESMFKRYIENLPGLRKGIKIQTQEAHRTSNKMNSERPRP
jgi:hypothetical protein